VNATVFLGGGRITSALVAGLDLAGYRKPIVAFDRHGEKLRALNRQYGVSIEADLHRAIARAQLLIVAVRPDSVAGLLLEMRRAVSLRRKGPRSPMIACSLAAGVPLAKLRDQLGSPVRWARAMPSPACRGGRGLTAIAFDRGFPARARRELLGLFRLVGPVVEIPERKFDAFTVTYSCSHGYHALAALAAAGEKQGLDRETALAAAAHALADGISAWREGKIPLNRLLHEAATPGGIAATVMAAMDRAGYRRMVEEGLRAGMARARANAKK
jgi:pyrroline-5-carboxylate reductase